MSAPNVCRLLDRERLAALYAADRLSGASLEGWESHLASCQACAEDAASDARWDALLAEEARANARAEPAGREASRIGWRRLRTWTPLASAACVLMALGVWWFLQERSPGDSRAERFVAAHRLADQGRRVEALAQFEQLLRERREYAVLFAVGHTLLNTGRAAEAVGMFREALRVGPAPAPNGDDTPPWYVSGHLAQALLASARGAENDAEIERILGADMAVHGLDASRNRCLIWAELARVRIYAREDLAGGRVALEAAERENEVHQAEADRIGRKDRDCHYFLHARFAFEEVALADSEAGRAVALRTRAAKEAAAEAVSDVRSASSYRADAREGEAVAEMLAARRGDPADLAKAGRLLAEALALRDASGNPEGIARCHARAAWLDLLESRPADALAESAEADKHAGRSGSADELVEARLLSAQSLLALGRRGEALLALERARAVPGVVVEARHALTIAFIELHASEDESVVKKARERLEHARTSALADVRLAAKRLLDAANDAATFGVGPADFGLDVRP